MIRRRQLLAATSVALPIIAARPSLAAAPRNMTVILDWLINPNHAGLFAARQRGAFTRAGLAVDLVSPSDPDSPPRLVAAGQADLAISYGSQINMLTEAGLPVVRVATVVASPLNTIMALGAVKSLEDLKGKTVGYSIAGVEEELLYAMIASAGLRPDDVSTVKVNYGMVAAMLSGRLDAAIGAYRNAEVIQVRDMQRTPAVFLPEQHGVPLYDELVLIARRDRLADSAIASFVRAVADGVATVRRDSEGVWHEFAAAHSEMDNAYNRQSWDATIPLLATDPGRLDRSRYAAFAAFCVSRGITRTAQKLDDYAVQIAT